MWQVESVEEKFQQIVWTRKLSILSGRTSALGFGQFGSVFGVYVG